MGNCAYCYTAKAGGYVATQEGENNNDAVGSSMTWKPLATRGSGNEQFRLTSQPVPAFDSRIRTAEFARVSPSPSMAAHAPIQAGSQSLPQSLPREATKRENGRHLAQNVTKFHSHDSNLKCVKTRRTQGATTKGETSPLEPVVTRQESFGPVRNPTMNPKPEPSKRLSLPPGYTPRSKVVCHNLLRLLVNHQQG